MSSGLELDFRSLGHVHHTSSLQVDLRLLLESLRVFLGHVLANDLKSNHVQQGAGSKDSWHAGSAGVALLQLGIKFLAVPNNVIVKVGPATLASTDVEVRLALVGSGEKDNARQTI